MADAASFLIELQDKLSGPAKGMQSALAGVEASLQRETKSLQVLESWMKRLNSAKVKDTAQIAHVSGLIDAQKGKLAGLSNQFVHLSQTAGAEGAAGGMAELGASFGGVAGMASIAVTAIVAVVAALGAATFALAKFALGQANSKRTSLIQFEALLGTRDAALELDDAIDAVAARTPIMGDRLESLGKQLAFAGVRGGELKKGLEAMAAVEAVVGEAAVDKYMKRIKAGEKLSKIMGEIQKKGILDKQAALMLDFDTQINKAKEGLGKIFEDIAIEPFLKALHEVLGMFDETSTTGKALKVIFQAMLQPIFDLATAALPYVVTGLKQLIIWGLKAYISLKAFSKTDTFDALVTGLKVIGVVLGVIAGLFIAATAIMAAPFIIVGGLVVGLIGLLANTVAAVIGFVGGMIDAGYNLVAGIAEGIASGASAVVDAAVGAAQGAINAVKSVLGIASPSKVMAEMGLHTMAGFGGGIEKGQNDVTATMASAVAPPPAAGAATGGARSQSNVFNITVNGGSGGPQETALAIRSELERFALQLGAA